MHLLILPFVLAGFTAKILNSKIKNKAPEKQIDIILSTFFTTLTPQHFGDIYESFENQAKESLQERAFKE